MTADLVPQACVHLSKVPRISNPHTRTLAQRSECVSNACQTRRSTVYLPHVHTGPPHAHRMPNTRRTYVQRMRPTRIYHVATACPTHGLDAAATW